MALPIVLAKGHLALEPYDFYVCIRVKTNEEWKADGTMHLVFCFYSLSLSLCLSLPPSLF